MNRKYAVEAQGLTKYFGARKAVDSLDLCIEKGIVVSLLGRNGAGKTTTIRMLLGMLAPSRGTCRLLGCGSANLTPEVKQHIGYLPEGHPLFGWMKLGQAARFFSGFYPRWKQRVFEKLVDYFGLPLDRKLRTLSRGERAQAALALTVAQDPELLILDDPTQGVDAVARREFLAALVALIRQQERTILFSSHVLGDVERVSDRIVVLDHGVVRADCPVDTFKQSVRRVTLDGKEQTRLLEGLPGLLQLEQTADVMTATVVDRDGSLVARIRQQAEGTVEVQELNLEEAFIAFTSGGQKRVLDLAEDTP